MRPSQYIHLAITQGIVGDMVCEFSGDRFLLALGVHPKLVQETLGHSTYQLTMDTYSHMIPELRNEVADRMDEILRPKLLETVNESVKRNEQTIH